MYVCFGIRVDPLIVYVGRRFEPIQEYIKICLCPYLGLEAPVLILYV